MYGRAGGGVSRRETWAAVPRTCAQMGVALLAEPPAERATAVVPTDDDLIALALSGPRRRLRHPRRALRTRGLPPRLPHAARGRGGERRRQEAWIKAYRALASFRPGAKFATWIFTICYRVCCDRLAKRKRFTGEEPPDFADPGAGPEGAFEAAEEAARLRAAIDALPEKYRAVITLFHLQGKQYEEIAAVLGSSARNRENASFPGKRPVTGRTGADAPNGEPHDRRRTGPRALRAAARGAAGRPARPDHGRDRAAPGTDVPRVGTVLARRRGRARRLADASGSSTRRPMPGRASPIRSWPARARLGLFSRSTYVWLAVGISSVWWISSLPFMATPRLDRV